MSCAPRATVAVLSLLIPPPVETQYRPASKLNPVRGSLGRHWGNQEPFHESKKARRISVQVHPRDQNQ
jgi:hypothetical protein